MVNKYILFLMVCLAVSSIICVTSIEAQTKSKREESKTSAKSKTRKEELTDYQKKLLADVEKQLEASRPTKFYVFVGEKVEVKPFEPLSKQGEILMDDAFKAKYKVIQNVYGDYDKEIIEFEAYDHYGVPPFSKYKNVLLFVSEYNGKLHHEKYQYFNVYKTRDGNWASCGDPYRFDEYHRKPFKAIKLEFDEPLTFDLEKLSPAQIKKIYPVPFYKVSGRKAFCLMGAYIEDLFSIKKNGVLKARRLFK